MALADASLSATNVVVAMLFFADFVDLPIRVAYAPCPLTVPVAKLPKLPVLSTWVDGEAVFEAK